jgi:hypothetical protein
MNEKSMQQGRDRMSIERSIKSFRYPLAIRFFRGPDYFNRSRIFVGLPRGLYETSIGIQDQSAQSSRSI